MPNQPNAPTEQPPEPNAPAPPAQDQFSQEALDSNLNALFNEPAPAQPVPPKAEPAKEKNQEVKPQVKEVAAQVEAAPENLADPESFKTPDKLKNQEGWKTLKDNYAKAHKRVSYQEDEIKKLKLSLAERGTETNQELEKLKKEVEDHRGFRAMVDLEADPEFIKTYDQPIEKIASQIKTLLVNSGGNSDLAGRLTLDHLTDGKTIKSFMDAMKESDNDVDANRLLRRVEELVELQEKRNETLVEHRTKYKDYLEKKKKESFGKQAEAEGRISKHLNEVMEAKDAQGNPRFAFLSSIVPKNGATPAELSQIEKHNKVATLMRGQLEEVLKSNEPEDRVEIAVAAIGAKWLNAQLNAAMTKIKSLEGELSKISAVSTETPSRTRTTPSAAKNGNMDLDTALSDHFSR